MEVRDAVAHVRLDRPAKLNGLTLEMLSDLVTAGHALRRDRNLRAVVLSGAGPSFCAGLDFASVQGQGCRVAAAFVPRPWRGTNTFQEACWVWRRLPVPVVAAVQGHCFGGGLQLALGADYRFTTPDAEWSVMEVRWGLVPDMSGIHTLKQQVGADVAKRLAMTGEIVDGSAAVRFGLASEVSDDPCAAALDLVERLRTRSPDALAATKRLVDGTWTAGTRHTFVRERAAQVRMFLARNTAIARRAAMARQEPDFSPRGTRR